jgi:hypothetical protein
MCSPEIVVMLWFLQIVSLLSFSVVLSLPATGLTSIAVSKSAVIPSSWQQKINQFNALYSENDEVRIIQADFSRENPTFSFLMKDFLCPLLSTFLQHVGKVDLVARPPATSRLFSLYNTGLRKSHRIKIRSSHDLHKN